jgi:hypothetical protein
MRRRNHYSPGQGGALYPVSFKEKAADWLSNLGILILVILLGLTLLSFLPGCSKAQGSYERDLTVKTGEGKAVKEETARLVPGIVFSHSDMGHFNVVG